jgi:hypothetical protein
LGCLFRGAYTGGQMFSFMPRLCGQDMIETETLHLFLYQGGSGCGFRKFTLPPFGFFFGFKSLTLVLLFAGFWVGFAMLFFSFVMGFLFRGAPCRTRD